MEAFTPIELLKNVLEELKSKPEVGQHIILEYEKAILVLELIGIKSFDDMVTTPKKTDNSDSNSANESKKEPDSYYERFMAGQRNRKPS